MLIKKYKVESYTISEFLNKEDISYLDRAIKHIKRNKNKYMLLVTIVALTIDLTAVSSFALAPGTEAINVAGEKILGLIRDIGYWVAIILCSKDVLKHLMRGHMESIGSIIAIYGLSFGVLYFLPWLFDLIKSIFA
ncbi:hypothetical protein [Romboutsia timonensis]|uniref:hypothetical protein n=1 Tax=Romboutsia timonensis TaxID=1776391 RepID=UPI002A81ADCE|nr:hypothetical protein [Romboutsia timonensis]MDY3960962.1 hypothetical protein [Romboutsia timonensis]